MPDDVSAAEKTSRFRRLEAIQKSQQNKGLQRYVHKVLKVLAERPSAKSADDLTGHSTCHRVVNFHGSDDMLGNIVNVRITEVKANSLFGEVV
jgi:tRNA-2-methylthio-N6-dimethylallyladenosine synthase